MANFTITGVEYHSERIGPVTSIIEAVQEFRERHPAAHIDSIDDKSVVGFCESCDRPFFDGDKYNYDDEGVVWCKRECKS